MARNYTAEADLQRCCQLQSLALQKADAELVALQTENAHLREDNAVLRREYADLRAEMDDVEETV